MLIIYYSFLILCPTILTYLSSSISTLYRSVSTLYPYIPSFDHSSPFLYPSILTRPSTSSYYTSMHTFFLLFPSIYLNIHSFKFFVFLFLLLSFFPPSPVRPLLLCDLNEQCHEIFRGRFFFYQTTSPGSSRQAQERFRIFTNIRGVIRIRNRLPGDEYTGELIRIP